MYLNKALKYLLISLLIFPINLFAKIKVVSGIPVYQSIVKDIAGDLVDTESIIEVKSDPHAFELSPSKVKILNGLNLYIASAQEFEEPVIKKIQSSNSTAKILNLYSTSDFADPHGYYSPAALSAQSLMIYNTLLELLPENKDSLTANYQTLKGHIASLDSEIKKSLIDKNIKQVYSYHDFLGAFAKEFNLEYFYATKGENEPNLKAWLKFLSIAKNAKIIFVNEKHQLDSLKDKLADVKIVQVPHFSSSWQKTIEMIINNLK